MAHLLIIIIVVVVVVVVISGVSFSLPAF